MTKKRVRTRNFRSTVTTFASLHRSRDFRIFFFAQVGSNIGTWMQITGLSWVVLDLTGSASKLGVVLAVETLPVLLLGPFAGTVIDRYDVRRLTVTTQTVLAVIVVALAALQLTGQLNYPTTLMLSFLFGVTLAIDSPARQTLLPELVDARDLSNAIAMNAVSLNGSSLLGPALGGLAVAWVGAAWCFVLNGLSFAAVAVALLAIPTDARRSSKGGAAPAAGPAAGIADAFRVVARTPVMRDALLMMALVGTFTYEFPVTLPLLARDSFEAGPTFYGLLFAAAGAGATVWGLRLAGQQDHDRETLANASVILGVFVLAGASVPHPVAEIAVFVLVGAASVRFMTLANAAVLENAPPQLRGRIMSFWYICFQGTTLVGAPAVGYVAAAMGARWALAVGGGAAICAGLLGRWSQQRERSGPRTLSV
ncbi:MFS transporter [Streptomyces sp. IB2014 016-6]|uniref:MFS transporter n=1 Tax=Streptomyces sp. IB2014 016-6 TaxID=2517818 RepID=UPI0016507F8B|nr:MFS transporter [Streptomyces sp. IB2014 016-6]